ncbi:type IV pilus subunit [Cystobacter fuscus DSM 2262]|uniref:Type IV pilus subunit n=1 Tax=Cystobacter fuscus (strain ATCC 25194 / DSM 2262 / NBRC 100088 / M29) TaxID=1242864 RepID=S9R6Y0_CYSF2|nr:prepilin-type N-terminal cleavage/methylation domain-containing protein [Cystobacter fuscus]EPX64783.1 type IV pilus subunit [Cystobacter fuscus DSM 2262]
MNRLIIRKHRGFSIIEFLIVVALLSILAAVALPNFNRFQTNARQGEAKANLKSWFSAQRAYHQENSNYSENVQTVGFLPERGNRYAYYFGSSGMSCIVRDASGVFDPANPNCITVDRAEFPNSSPTPKTMPPHSPIYEGEGANPGMPGLGGCPPGMNCNISGLAAGNIDDENIGIDTWWISTKDTVVIQADCGNSESESIAGEPYNSYNDADCNI